MKGCRQGGGRKRRVSQKSREEGRKEERRGIKGRGKLGLGKRNERGKEMVWEDGEVRKDEKKAGWAMERERE